jgi:aminoglycoside phosphotransferase (APT) family kinase protein
MKSRSSFRTGDAAVPQPIAAVDDLGMTLQRVVVGETVTEKLAGAQGVALMARAARAIRALHTCGVTPTRKHTLTDELQILDKQLAPVQTGRPDWAGRIERVLDACRSSASSLAESGSASLHRDFYPDQLIEHEGQVTLLDLDLCATGDPALDIGNFVAHLTEHALRHHGDPAALSEHEGTLEEAYLSLANGVTQEAIRVHASLTLARHIAISTRIPGRERITADLLDLCEQRLEIRSSGAPASNRSR